ncbi:hypothetical protein FRB99_007570 [Tulasnella sp. 403]|nr:hypothetical protein FRB99_007570 [Tulasnella sp. 403]
MPLRLGTALPPTVGRTAVDVFTSPSHHVTTDVASSNTPPPSLSLSRVILAHGTDSEANDEPLTAYKEGYYAPGVGIEWPAPWCFRQPLVLTRRTSGLDQQHAITEAFLLTSTTSVSQVLLSLYDLLCGRLIGCLSGFDDFHPIVPSDPNYIFQRTDYLNIYSLKYVHKCAHYWFNYVGPDNYFLPIKNDIVIKLG